MGDVGDSQLHHGEEYAYNQASFVEFYDLMTQSLPEEYEEDLAIDVEVYKRALRSAGSDSLVAVDLATGTGRVLVELMSVETCDKLMGVDHSQAMLDACQKRVAQAVDSATRVATNTVPAVQLSCQSMQTLRLPEYEGECDAVIISAGSFHHLTSRQEQLAALKNVLKLLKPQPDSVAVVSLLKDDQCLDSDSEQLIKV